MLAMNTSCPDAKPLLLVPLKQRLTKAVAKEHAFLREVDELADVLYDEDVIRVSAIRYERLWIPAVAALSRQGLPIPSPPLDIAYMWHCHVLCPTRYFSDWEHLAGTVPTFVFPGACNDELPDDSPPGLDAKVDLSSKASALESMWRSLGEQVSAASAADLVAAWGAQPASQLSYDIAAAALRQRVFFYQVSLPHYRAAGFIRQAVNRYITFLGLRQVNPGVKLCPTYDIDLVWHSHMSLPHQYKADTEALLGMHLPHDDSINDRSDGSELQDVQRTTERLFDEAGEQFFQAGGMFRGIPTRLTPEQREACSPEAPPSCVRLSFKGVEWMSTSDSAQGRADSEAHSGRTITAWSLQQGSRAGSLWRRSEKKLCMQPVKDAVEARSSAAHTLHVRIEETSTKQSRSGGFIASAAVDVGNLLEGSDAAENKEHVAVVVPLGRKGGRSSTCCIAVLMLHLERRYRCVVCPGPMSLPQWARSSAFVNCEHESAAQHVSQPELLLPVSAVNDKGTDAAETRSFLMPVQGGMHEDSFAGAPMLARVTNTSKHLATAVEVFATTAGGPAALPAATAHSINMSTLPLLSSEFNYGGVAVRSSWGARVFLIRSGDKDWGLLYGWWTDQGGAGRPYTVLFVLDAGRSWNHVGRGDVNVNVQGRPTQNLHLRSHGKFQSQTGIRAGDAPVTAAEAGRLAAVAAAVSLCRSLLLVMVMPCTRAVQFPQSIPSVIRARSQDNVGEESVLGGSEGHVVPARACTRLPTNPYIAKRLYALRTREPRDVQARGCTLPWYGTVDATKITNCESQFWGGPGFSPAKMAARRKAWANANRASQKQAGGGGPQGGGCAAACGAGAGCAFVEVVHVEAATCG